MKVLLLAALFSTHAMAAQIECFSKSNHQSALFIADDLGSISTGGITLPSGAVYNFENLDTQSEYSYFYGEYLTINALIAKEGATSKDRVNVALVKVKNGKLEGVISINPDRGTVLIPVTCRE